MDEIFKRCAYCGKEWPESMYGVAITTPTKVYRRRKCRDCYRATKQKLVQKHYEWLADYKQKGGCHKCGITDPRVLDFHHIDEKGKLFTIGGFRREVGFSKLQVEIAKCVIVCANCHRVLHDEIRKDRQN